MIKYFFVTKDGELFINLPLSVSRDTISYIMADLKATQIYYYVASGVKLFLDI